MRCLAAANVAKWERTVTDDEENLERLKEEEKTVMQVLDDVRLRPSHTRGPSHQDLRRSYVGHKYTNYIIFIAHSRGQPIQQPIKVT